MMKENRRYCFTNPQGEDIFQFYLSNNKGTEVIISNYGAIITTFRVRNEDSEPNDIVLGFDDMQQYTSKEYLENYPWFGAAIGRYGNRIKDAHFQIDGHNYPLTKNSGNNQLHGGLEGFDKKVWKVEDSGIGMLLLSYNSPHGDEGYPGNLDVKLLYTLNDADELSYEFTATTDKPTAVNLTHHSYFNMNNGHGTIKEHELKIPAENYLEQDKNLVVTGKLIPVKDTAHDFTQRRKIADGWNETTGYDQSYVTEKEVGEFGLVAEAWSAQSGTKLEVWSTEPVVHFYSGVWIPGVKGKNETTYKPYSGFCLETQIHPNAINIPHFPNTVLMPGEKYYQKTVYKVIQEPLK